MVGVLRGRGATRIDRRGPDALLPFITPTEQFYKFTNDHWPDPVDASATVVLGGGGRSATTAWADLARGASDTVVRTIVCDGNGYRGQRKPALGCSQAADPEETGDHPDPVQWTWRYGGIGTARWGGLTLRALFDRAHIPMTGTHVRIEARDNYVRWFPLSAARSDDFLVATTMNGAPLPHRHGAPARLVAPGQYGQMSVKWIRSISCGTRTGAHPWDGGSPEHFPVKPQAFATGPLDGASVPRGEVELVGAAYAGEQAVGAVLLQLPGEDPIRAELLDPPARFVWTRWRAVLPLHQPGATSVDIACADVLGRTSMPQSAWGDAVGYGGLHRLHLTVT